MCERGNMRLCVLGRGLETKKVQYLLQKKTLSFIYLLGSSRLFLIGLPFLMAEIQGLWF